jgi:hypothetical protein
MESDISGIESGEAGKNETAHIAEMAMWGVVMGLVTVPEGAGAEEGAASLAFCSIRGKSSG